MTLCYAPWGLLQVDIHGRMSFCCFNEASAGFGNIQDYSCVRDAYNNEAITAVRTALVKGDYKAAGCAHCKLVKINGQGVAPPVEEAQAVQSQAQGGVAEQNLVNNLNECLAGKTELSSVPAGYTVTVSHKCNIGCFMCWQRDEHGNYDPAELSDDIFEKLEPVYLTARSLHWVGGEPFALKPVHQFISSFDTKLNPNLRIMATSNALLLKDKVLERLSRFKNVSLVLSIDGVTKKTYEYVRTGASWETLQQVLPPISKVASERGWAVCINFVVMVSNIHELPAAVDFARKYHFVISFDPLSGDRLKTENLFRYPELIRRVPKWRHYIDEALRRADQHTESTEWASTGTGTAGDCSSAPSDRFRDAVKQRLEYIRSLLTAGEQAARTARASKRHFLPLSRIWKWPRLRAS